MNKNISDNLAIAQQLLYLETLYVNIFERYENILLVNSDCEEAWIFEKTLTEIYQKSGDEFKNTKLKIIDNSDAKLTKSDFKKAIIFIYFSDNHSLELLEQQFAQIFELKESNTRIVLLVKSDLANKAIPAKSGKSLSEFEYNSHEDNYYTIDDKRRKFLEKITQKFKKGRDFFIYYANLFGPTIETSPINHYFQEVAQNKAKISTPSEFSWKHATYLDTLYKKLFDLIQTPKLPYYSFKAPFDIQAYRFYDSVLSFFPENNFPKGFLVQSLTKYSNLINTYFSYLTNSQIEEISLIAVNKKYYGKLKLINEYELKMLDKVQKICEKHQIKYFLVGGSILGAIRHQGVIPWDDDLDIGMLRKDYDKFNKVVDQELDDEFYYQSDKKNDGSKYIFGKIRLKNTFFSTNWSHRFNIADGIFIDILPYDNLPKNKILQFLQIRFLRAFRIMINDKWGGVKRVQGVGNLTSGIYWFWSKILSFSALFGLFNFTAKFYQYDKKSKFLMDTGGLNLERVGAFPKSWFDELVWVDFEGRKVPVPKEYQQYLIRWFGPNHMKWPPLSLRKLHQIARIDLGGESYEMLNKKLRVYDYPNDEIIDIFS